MLFPLIDYYLLHWKSYYLSLLLTSFSWVKINCRRHGQVVAGMSITMISMMPHFSRQIIVARHDTRADGNMIFQSFVASSFSSQLQAGGRFRLPAPGHCLVITVITRLPGVLITHHWHHDTHYYFLQLFIQRRPSLLTPHIWALLGHAPTPIHCRCRASRQSLVSRHSLASRFTEAARHRIGIDGRLKLLTI